MIDELAAYLYRVSPAVPDLVLKRLGIATPRRRPEFSHARDLDRPDARGSGLDPRVRHLSRRATLLGMAHLFRRRGPSVHASTRSTRSRDSPSRPRSDAQPNGKLHPDRSISAPSATPSYEDLLARIELLGWSGLDQRWRRDSSRTRWSGSSTSGVLTLVHLDCDLYESYLTCLEFCLSADAPQEPLHGLRRLTSSPLGVYPGADRKLVDEFFADKPEKPERLPGHSDPVVRPIHRADCRYVVLTIWSKQGLIRTALGYSFFGFTRWYNSRYLVALHGTSRRSTTAGRCRRAPLSPPASARVDSASRPPRWLVS